MQGTMPSGVFLGIKDSKLILHRDAIINDPEGLLLNGVVSLRDRQFIIDNDWYESQTEKSLNNPIDAKDPNGVFTLIDCFPNSYEF